MRRKAKERPLRTSAQVAARFRSNALWEAISLDGRIVGRSGGPCQRCGAANGDDAWIALVDGELVTKACCERCSKALRDYAAGVADLKSVG